MISFLKPPITLCHKFILSLPPRLKELVTRKKTYIYQVPTRSRAILEEIQNLPYTPVISVIIPVYNVDPKWLQLAISSVQNQWYTHWQICIADDCSNNPATRKYLLTLQAELEKNKDKTGQTKFKIHLSQKNEHISANYDKALAMADGDYIALLDHDDQLTLDALYEVAKAINDSKPDFIYSDEDKIDSKGIFSEPHFKPNYSYFMLCSQNYIRHLTVIRKSLIDKVGGFAKSLNGAYKYDLYLKIAEKSDNFHHIPKVLYHFREKTDLNATPHDRVSEATNGLIAVKKHLERVGVLAQVQSLTTSGKAIQRVVHDIVGNPLISIVIPFKDKPELLDACINSILTKTTYQNFEIIAINNGSCHPESFELMKILQTKDSRVTFHNYNTPFNYSKINNYGVSKLSSGEYIVLLNNDIEIISPDWIETMLGFAQQPKVGSVGAKLYYPDDTIQHGGILVGVGHVAAHAHRFFPKSSMGYHGRLAVDQELSAVTGAMLMVGADKYRLLGGLNEKDLAIAYNDVDFCLRLVEHGFTNVFTPHAEAYHHESSSREADESPSNKKRYGEEVNYMWQRHEDVLHAGDPYYNPNLTVVREDFSQKP